MKKPEDEAISTMLFAAFCTALCCGVLAWGLGLLFFGLRQSIGLFVVMSIASFFLSLRLKGEQWYEDFLRVYQEKADKSGQAKDGQ